MHKGFNFSTVGRHTDRQTDRQTEESPPEGRDALSVSLDSSDNPPPAAGTRMVLREFGQNGPRPRVRDRCLKLVNLGHQKHFPS